MSMKLEQALATKKVLVKKIVSGEVTIHFKDSNVKDIVISHDGIIDLLSKRGVNSEAIRNSNVRDLISRNIIKIL